MVIEPQTEVLPSGARQEPGLLSILVLNPSILIGGLLLSRMLAVVGVIDDMVLQVTALADTPVKFMILASVLYIVLGCFLDAISMILITIPVFLPLAQGLGYDAVWFGILVLVVVEVGMITPPVGLNLFVISGITGESVLRIASRAGPYVIGMLIVVLLLAFIPSISLWAF